MTVLVRPSPPRVGGNRVVPYRQPPKNNVRPYPIKFYNPPTPQPLPHAPFLDWKFFVGIGVAAAVKWLWDWLNSRPKASTTRPDNAEGPTGSWDPIGYNVFTVTYSATRVFFDSCTTTPYSWQSEHTVLAPQIAWLEDRGTSTGHDYQCGAQWPAVRNGAAVLRSLKVGDTTDSAVIDIVPGSQFIPDSVKQTVIVRPLSGIGEPFPLPPGALPDWDPGRFPEIEVAPPATLPKPKPKPLPLPPEIDREPDVLPQPPEPKPPLEVKPPITTPRPKPIPPGAIDVDNGEVVKPKPDPPITTDPESHFPRPGGGPITGAGARPDLTSIANEVSRIEQKVAKLMNPAPAGGTDLDRLGLIAQALERILNSLFDGAEEGSYQLTSPCVKDDSGARIPLSVGYPATSSNWDRISVKVDAIAGLLQAHKELLQPVCPKVKPAALGEWVTVNFESLAKSPAGDRRMRKVLRYRDQSYRSLEYHAGHWHDYEWDSGPVCVIHKGLEWGVPQVWAATAAEGKRVLTHAATAAGINLADPKGEWIVTHSDSPRIGQAGRMAVRRLRNGALMVSKRMGSDGLAEYPIPTR